MQINHLIRVSGFSNSGKTATITWCFHKFLENTFLCGFQALENGDFVAVVAHKKNKIAFISGGDNKKQVKANYNALESLGIKDIAVCVFATRTKGGSVQFWREIAKENKTKIKLLSRKRAKSKSAKEINACNQRNSDALFKKIKAYL